MRMLRWIRGHTRKDKIRDDCIQGDIGVMSIEEKMIENLLRWFGHMQKRPSNAPVRRVACMVSSPLKRGQRRPTTLEEVVKRCEYCTRLVSLVSVLVVSESGS